jgi:Tfp pilus assembly protein PilV
MMRIRSLLLPARRSRRGLTMLEVLLSGSLMLGVVFILAGLARFLSMFWQQGMAVTSTQLTSQMALQQVAPSIRAARRVVAAQSSANRLTLQLPAYDGAGNLILPMVDGDVVSYYLSDRSGSIGIDNGTILWRSVNGVPDREWSLGGGKGRVVVGPQGLTFSYYPSAANAETVTVSVTATSVSGTRKDTLPTSQEVVLRNKDL